MDPREKVMVAMFTIQLLAVGTPRERIAKLLAEFGYNEDDALEIVGAITELQRPVFPS